MDEISIARIIDEINEQRGLSLQQIPCRSSTYISEYEGYVRTFGKITIAFTSYFPTEIPDIFLSNPHPKQLHVDKNGKLCLMDKSSLLLDVDNPIQIVIDCLEKAIEVLKIQPGSKEYQKELQREFLSYWMQSCDFALNSILDTTNVHCEEYPVVVADSEHLIANTKDEAVAFLHNVLKEPVDKIRVSYGLVIKMRENSELPFPSSKYKWSDIRHYILKNSSNSTKRLFRKYIEKKIQKRNQSIFIVLPADTGDILFGFIVQFHNNRNIPIRTSKANRIIHMAIRRMDYKYIVTRGGAAPLLRTERVLLLGCGSVGGFIADNLCQMGTVYLDLLDKDDFMIENIHRHILGFDAYKIGANLNKADLLKLLLEEKYAYVDIDALNYKDRLAQAFLSEPNRLASYNLIISALGEPTLNLEINRLLKTHDINVPFICCFNEPYSIGGHVIITNLSMSSCLQCLYSDPVSGELIPFRGSLVSPGQNFKRSLSGCAGSFVPYSVLDSKQTAIFTVRKAVEVLNGQLAHNQLFSWKGDASLLQSQGFKPSKVYESDSSYFRILDDFANSACPKCNRK